MFEAMKMRTRHMSITPKIGNFDSKNEIAQSFKKDGLKVVKETEKSSKTIHSKLNESIKSHKSNSVRSSFESSSISSFDSYYNISIVKNLINNSTALSLPPAKIKWKKALNAIKFKNILLKEKASDIGEDNNDENDNEHSNTIDRQKDNSDDDINRSEHSLSTSSINNLVMSQDSKKKSNQNKQTVAKFNNNNSYFRSAIPSLPLALAVICLTANFCIPGFGQ